MSSVFVTVHLGVDCVSKSQLHETPLTKVYRNFWIPHQLIERRYLSEAYIPYFFNDLVLNCRVFINLFDKIRQKLGAI